MFAKGVAIGSSWLLIAALGACSSSPDSKPDELKLKVTPTAPAPSVDPIGLSTIEDSRVEISDEPDWLATGFGSVWALRGNGSVARLSPRGKVQADIDPELYQPPPCQGIGASETAVWACATPGTIMRIDPETNDVAETVEVPKINEQGRLPSSDGQVWLLTGDGDELAGLSERTNQLGDPIDLGTFCTDVADRVDRGTLWVVCASEGVLLRVDLAKKKVTGKVTDLPLAASVSVDEDVWVGFDEGIARIDPSSLEVTMLQEAVTPDRIRAIGDHVWVREAGGEAFLSRLDGSSAEVGQVIAAKDLTSGGDVLELDGTVWATSYDDLTVVRLTP